MGCSASNLGVITEDELNPALTSEIDNQRVKTNLFDTGEIYYLRNAEALKKGITKPNKSFLSYDELTIRLKLSYKFTDESLKKDFEGVPIKFYHSDIVKDSQFTYVGITERLKPNAINYTKTFTMQYCFQKPQLIKCEIILKQNIQVIDVYLGKILGSRFLTVELPFFFKGTSENTSLVIDGEVLKDENKSSFITFSLATDLSKLPFSDYYVIIYNWNNGVPTKVWKSKEQTGKKFFFQASMVTMQDLCMGDRERKITFEFYGIYSGLIGTVESTLTKLEEAMNNHQPIEIREANNLNGYFKVKYSIEKISRFIDLIENGLQIALYCAIDYTSSNKDYTDPTSLHFLSSDPNVLNPYEQTIVCLGNILQNYHFTRVFPLLGFGAALKATNETSHCFYPNFKKIPFIEDGVEGILETYRNSFEKIRLDGPTYFSPIIKNSIQLLKESDSQTSVYHIILIIADGNLHDIDETKTTIIKNSYLPYSVIIIGVGNEDFRVMKEEFNKDKTTFIDKNGNQADRDIVQCIVYRDFLGKPIQMAEEILMQIPTQIEQYYRLYKRFVGTRDV